MSIISSLAILFTPSEYTPWKENINEETLLAIENYVPQTIHVNRVEFSGFTEANAIALRQYDLVLNVCYGFHDADQVDIALWLELNNIAHTGSHAKAMQIAQDKEMLPNICSEIGLHTPVIMHKASVIDFNKVYIAKPRFGSCHRNISILNAVEARKEIDTHTSDMLIQEYIIGREFSVAVIPDENAEHYQALIPVEIYPKNNEEMYIAGNGIVATDKNFHPDLSEAMIQSLMEIALRIHVYLGLSFMSRIDVRICPNGKVFILDINTLPNLDPKRSILPKICSHQGISYEDLLRRIISLGNNILVSKSMFAK